MTQKEAIEFLIEVAKVYYENGNAAEGENILKKIVAKVVLYMAK